MHSNTLFATIKEKVNIMSDTIIVMRFERDPLQYTRDL